MNEVINDLKPEICSTHQDEQIDTRKDQRYLSVDVVVQPAEGAIAAV
jgi:hypothetical protein